MSWLLAFILVLSIPSTSVTAASTGKKAPVKTRITEVRQSGEKQLSVTYKKAVGATKYQIQISTNKRFKKVVKSKLVQSKIKKVTFKNLNYGKYYIRVRSYRVVAKKKYYSPWSAVNSCILRKTVKKKVSEKETQKTTPSKPDNSKDDNNTSTAVKVPDNTDKVPDKNNSSDDSPETSTKQETSTTDKSESTDGNRQMSSIEECTVNLYNLNLTYDGMPKYPKVVVRDKEGYYLSEKEAYTLTYSNNIDAGTATVYINGIGEYTGTIAKNFEISKATPNSAMVAVEKGETKVGEEIKVDMKGYSAKDYVYTIYKHYEKQPTEAYTEVNENNQLIAKKAGDIIVYVSVPESTNYYAADMLYAGQVFIYNDTNPVSGFNQMAVEYKSSIKDSTVENGIASFDIEFYSEASPEWLENHMKITVEDVTPKAYSDTFQRFGLNMQAPQGTIKDITQEVRSDVAYRYGMSVVQKPYGEGSNNSYEEYACLTAQKVMITAGEGVRVCKVCAYKDGKLYDSIYIATKPYNKNGEELDKELYKDVRHKVEKQLWNDNMSNYEKLKALAAYINSTTHYPGYGCTQKDKNPTFWNDFSVDDIDLYYYMFDIPTLNRIMDLQGGITTCLAIDIVERAATEDLNLPYLYDSETGTIAQGEGVWLASGSASSNPYSPGHVSLIYKNSNGEERYLDAQGMSEDNSCEEHGCLNKIIK